MDSRGGVFRTISYNPLPISMDHGQAIISMNMFQRIMNNGNGNDTGSERNKEQLKNSQ